MKILHGIRPDLLAASAVTLGMFDGVHQGHRALLRACRAHADRLRLPAVVLTYEPHPAKVLRPDAEVRLLTTFDEKVALLADEGMDWMLVVPFTRDFSLLAPEAFLADVLVASLHPRVVVAGYRTTFGHARAGTAAVLRAAGERQGFAVEIVEPVEIAGGPVSSSRIRGCLDDGDVEIAADLLGYQYRLTGEVTHGDARGRTLGVPTANLQAPADKLLPRDGVYAVEACVGEVTSRAVMHIGSRPTFHAQRTLEVHLLDFAGDLYRQSMTVTFLARLREVREFPSPDALQAQIREDIARARRYPQLPDHFQRNSV